MANPVPTSVPAKITAGDTLSWSRSLPDYPANGGWVLKYRLINAAGKIDITAGASGADHLVSVTAATSAAYAAGTYDWQEYVEKGTERYTTGAGSIVVSPNLAAQAGGLDTRTDARRMLDAVNAWLVARDLAVAEYEIAGRRMKYIPIADLIALRGKLQAEVNREEAAARIMRGESPGNKLLVRF
jgi:hypothetical protein